MDMKKVVTLKVFLVLTLAVAISGCKQSSSTSRNQSRATGWQINAKEGGFQYNTDFKEQETSPGLVFVEGGTFTKGRVQDDVMHDWNNSPIREFTHLLKTILEPFIMEHYQTHLFGETD